MNALNWSLIAVAVVTGVAVYFGRKASKVPPPIPVDPPIQPPVPPASSGPRGIQKVFMLILENTDIGDALKQPYLARLALDGAQLKDHRGIRHPSQPNYIAFAAGRQIVKDNDIEDLDSLHLGDVVQGRGKTWQMFGDGYPSTDKNGKPFLDEDDGDYCRKHFPFLSFINVNRNLARAAACVQPGTAFDPNHLADFTLYIPDNEGNGHDSGVKKASQYVEGRFGKFFAKLPPGVLVIVVFDEDGGSDKNHVYCALSGDMVKRGGVATYKTNHFALHRLVAEVVGGKGLGDAASAPALLQDDALWSKPL